MKTTVKNLDKGTYGMTANMKKLLVEIVGLNDSKYFGRKLKVNRTEMLIESLGNNKYKVTEFTRYAYQTNPIYNVEISSK